MNEFEVLSEVLDILFEMPITSEWLKTSRVLET